MADYTFTQHGNNNVQIGDVAAMANEIARLTSALADMTAERDARIMAVLTPIYTCGGHGYEDDDDEDFWCPVCHAHLGTHRGFAVECPRCKQTINGDGEPIYHYRDMLRSEEEWRGPDAQPDRRAPQEAGQTDAKPDQGGEDL